MEQPVIAVDMSVCEDGLPGSDPRSPFYRVSDTDRYTKRLRHAFEVRVSVRLPFDIADAQIRLGR